MKFISEKMRQRIAFVVIHQYERMIGDFLIEIAGNMPYDNYILRHLAKCEKLEVENANEKIPGDYYGSITSLLLAGCGGNPNEKILSQEEFASYFEVVDLTADNWEEYFNLVEEED